MNHHLVLKIPIQWSFLILIRQSVPQHDCKGGNDWIAFTTSFIAVSYQTIGCDWPITHLVHSIKTINSIVIVNPGQLKSIPASGSDSQTQINLSSANWRQFPDKITAKSSDITYIPLVSKGVHVHADVVGDWRRKIEKIFHSTPTMINIHVIMWVSWVYFELLRWLLHHPTTHTVFCICCRMM